MSKSDGPGVAANRARKRRLWLLFGSVVVAAVALHAVLTRVIHPTPDGRNSIPAALGIVAAVGFVLILNVGVWLHLRWADELDRQHNVTAFVIGYLFNISAYAAWLLLWCGGLVPRPDAFILFLSTGIAAFVPYCWMKLKTHLG